jgi:membrane protein DedA with SNARE-associated domain
MDHILSVIDDNAYVILLAAAALNSTIISLLGGVASHAGHISIYITILVLFLGTVGANQVYFYLGRKSMQFFQKHTNRDNTRSKRIMHFIEHYEIPFIVVYRFIPGFRIVTPYIMGMSTHLTLFKFLILDSIGSAIWALLFGILGFLFGAVAEKVFKDVQNYENIAFAIIIAVGLIIFAFKIYRKYQAYKHG